MRRLGSASDELLESQQWSVGFDIIVLLNRVVDINRRYGLSVLMPRSCAVTHSNSSLFKASEGPIDYFSTLNSERNKSSLINIRD